MLPFFWYMLKVIICSGILFGYYWCFLRNKIFHQYNRFYLLAAISLSLLLPLLKIDFWQPAEQKNHAILVLQAVSAGDEYISLVSKKKHWNAEQLYPMVYILVSVVFFIVMLRTLYLIRTLLKKYPLQQVEEVAFINTQDDSTPFSFLKYIFWNSSIDLNTSTGRQIFKHEIAHIQEKHTYDKLFVNTILVFCWCNPFFWIYRKELNMIHEFIADKKAVEDNDTSAFAAMILQAAYPKHRFELANNFFYSPIKRRLMMLTKKQNPRVNYIGRIMVLPLAVLIFAAFTFKTKTNTSLNSGNVTRADAVNAINTESNLKNQAVTGDIVSIKEQWKTIAGKFVSKADTNPAPQIKSVTIHDANDGKVLIEVGSRKANLLFVLDDVVQGDDFNLTQVKADDIASIDVIKDKTAIARYGQPTKEGVIIIRTKKLPVTGVNPNTQKIEDEILELKLKETDLAKEKQKFILEEKIQKLAVKKYRDSAGALILAGVKLDNLEKQKIEIAEYNKAKLAYSNKLEEVVVQGYPLDKSRLQEKQIVELKHKLNSEQHNLAKLNYSEKLKTNLPVEKMILLEKELQSAKSNMIFTQAEVNPQFTGGQEAWIKFLRTNLKANVPVDNGAKAGTYKVVLRFMVNSDGSLSDITCESDPGFGICAEALRFIKTTPKWQPAVQNGKKVNAYMKQPITFVVEEQ